MGSTPGTISLPAEISEEFLRFSTWGTDGLQIPGEKGEAFFPKGDYLNSAMEIKHAHP
jgi:hypothetical protein